ncbi:MAG: DUF3618 domain-containing protein [Candidatus Eremiobacteraeota bacterium]|nr:DUF3618 domain-containing protein [Candidatus Eremiobacteraeota bacterium]MCW5866404.1 DUF3618 domain-containing protein [Candidatus Eremiobacteraeota bacterium]
MDSSNDLKNQSPEEIRGQIDQTRDALGDKLGALGEKMEDAKSAVQDKMEEVREKLSLSHRVQQNPWTAFFGAVGVGLVAGHMLTAPSRPEPHRQESSTPGVGAGLLSLVSGSALGGMFDQEIKSALTSALQAIWGEARSSVPPTIAGPVDRLLDRMSVRQRGFSHLGSLRG